MIGKYIAGVGVFLGVVLIPTCSGVNEDSPEPFEVSLVGTWNYSSLVKHKSCDKDLSLKGSVIVTGAVNVEGEKVIASIMRKGDILEFREGECPTIKYLKEPISWQEDKLSLLKVGYTSVELKHLAELLNGEENVDMKLLELQPGKITSKYDYAGGYSEVTESIKE